MDAMTRKKLYDEFHDVCDDLWDVEEEIHFLRYNRDSEDPHQIKLAGWRDGFVFRKEELRLTLYGDRELPQHLRSTAEPTR